MYDHVFPPISHIKIFLKQRNCNGPKEVSLIHCTTTYTFYFVIISFDQLFMQTKISFLFSQNNPNQLENSSKQMM